jgi:uracil phosphoribosyltransferase
MCATGGSALAAIECLLQEGCKEEQIIFVNLIGCEEGQRERKKEKREERRENREG